MPAPQIPLTGSIGPTGPFALLGFSAVALADADHNLTVAEYGNLSLQVTGALTAIRHVIAPLAQGMTFLVENATTGGFAVVLEGASGAGVSVPPGQTALVTCPDAANYVAPASAGAQIIAADAAALTAFPASGLPNGQLAVVETYGAIFTLGPASTALAPSLVLAASDGRVWQRGPTLVAPQALAQTTWIIDPADSTGFASDENTGLTSGAPLLSYSEILRRWGSNAPKLTAAVVTITWLSSGLSTDDIIAQPVQGTIILQGTQTAAAPITLGTYTAKDKTAGTLATINVAGHGAWAVGTLIHDITANAGFSVIADLGGGTAQISQPLSLPINTGSTEVALVNGDSLAVIIQTAMSPLALGGIQNSPNVFVNNFALTQNAAVVRVAGGAFLQECTLAGLSYQGARANTQLITPLMVGCFSFATGGGSGIVAGPWAINGGALMGSGNNFGEGTTLDLDVALPLQAHFTGLIELGSVYLGTFFEYTEGFSGSRIELHSVAFPAQPTTLYGPATIAVAGGATLAIQGSTTAVASLLCTGGVSLDGPAFSFDATTGLFVGPTAVTPAAIDAGGGLQNPATGSRISFAG